MTLVTIDLGDVAGGHHPDDYVTIRAEAFRESQGGGITSTAEVKIPLVDGVGQEEVEPGPVVVAFRCQAVADTREKRGVVPESGPVGVEDVIAGAFEYTPPVVNRGLDLIEDARDEALGQVEGAVAAEVDAIKWARGQIPAGATLDTLDMGLWWSTSTTVAEGLGLAPGMRGALHIVKPGSGHSTATFSSTGADREVWQNTSGSDGVWRGWVRIDEGRSVIFHGDLPAGATLDSLAPGRYWAQTTTATIEGLPVSLSGDLDIVRHGPYGRATYTARTGPREVLMCGRGPSGWDTWKRIDDTSPFHERLPAGATLDDVVHGSYWVQGNTGPLGLPSGMGGSLHVVMHSVYGSATFVATAAGEGIYVAGRSSSVWGEWKRVDTPPTPAPDPEPSPDPVEIVREIPSWERYPDLQAPLTSDTSTVWMWGDSLTYAGGITDKLNALKPGVTFLNRGLGTQDSFQIAARQGGMMPTIEVDGGAIPASGPVAVTDMSQNILVSAGYAVQSITGTIQGVHGTLTNDDKTQNYTFTRTDEGAITPVPEGALFVPDESLTSRRHAQIIWAGTNGMTRANPVVAVSKMLNWLTPHQKKVLVVSIAGASSWTRNTSVYKETHIVNEELRRMCGDSFVDLRRWLIDHALDVMGVTPTEADLLSISRDAIPESLTTDKLHFTEAAQEAIGNFLHGELVARGWWE